MALIIFTTAICLLFNAGLVTGNCIVCRYNEMEPVSLNTSYLAASTAGVYSAMAEADKNAIWIMQGWMFENDPYWNNSMVCIY
jgi:hypothetical protein